MRRNKLTVSRALIHLLFILMCASFIIPMIYVISISLSDEQALTQFGYRLFPKVVSTRAYMHIFQNPTQLLNSYKTTGGELYNDEYGQIKRRFNPLYEKATLEEALLATGKTDLYDVELDRVYDDEIYMKWHQNYVEHTSGQKSKII